MQALFWILIIHQWLRYLALPNRLRHKLRNSCKLISLLLSLKGKTRYYRKSTPAKAAIAQTLPTDAEFNAPRKSGRRFRKKPEWVRQEVIYLLAMNPGTSLRFIEGEFNRKYALTTNHTISHTYVSQVLKKHAYEIKTLAREKHNQRPRSVPRHLIWAADLTFLPDTKGNPQPILGVVEHASRACLCLKAIDNKTSVTILRALADIIELTQQKPKFLRTDNERNFTGKAFRFGLLLVRIKQQLTEVASPWQNGKVERFIYTDVMYAGFAGAKTCLWDF